MGLPFTTHTVHVVRPPVVPDAYGNRSSGAKDWDNAARTGPWDAVVQPDSASGSSLATKEDHTGGRERVETRIRVWLPAGTDVRATDGIEVPPGPNAGLYEVMGSPADMPDPFGAGSHLVLNATKIRG